MAAIGHAETLLCNLHLRRVQAISQSTSLSCRFRDMLFSMTILFIFGPRRVGDTEDDDTFHYQRSVQFLKNCSPFQCNHDQR
jgi:hypothetical protein